jgi:hypothetical protein
MFLYEVHRKPPSFWVSTKFDVIDSLIRRRRDSDKRGRERGEERGVTAAETGWRGLVKSRLTSN